MTHIVEAAGYIRPDGQVGRVFVKWDDPDDHNHVHFPMHPIVAILGPDMLKFRTLSEASRYLAQRDAAIGSLVVVNDDPAAAY